MLGMLAALSRDGGVLWSADAALLREAETLMPPGPFASPLVAADGRPFEPQGFPGGAAATAAPSGAALVLGGGGGAAFVASDGAGPSPAVRRAAEAIKDELVRYFQAHKDVRMPNARSVFGNRFGRWAAGLEERNPSLEEVHWWCEMLRRVEDARLFTRSNWVRASDFEDALAHCRLVLVDLRGRLEQEAAGSGLQHLREALEVVHTTGRAAADCLAEFLYIALRPKPASDRACFHALQQQAQSLEEAPHTVEGRRQEAPHAVEDRLVLLLIQLEEQQRADAVVPAFMRATSVDAEGEEEDGEEGHSDSEGGTGEVEFEEEGEAGRSFTVLPKVAAKMGCPVVGQAIKAYEALRIALDTGAGPPTTRISAELVHRFGKKPVEAFLELHGLYCLLSALLQRVLLSVQAVREYATFVCFLPVHRATILDLERLLPELRKRIAVAAQTVTTAYESLPRAAVPPCRGALLEKGGCLQRQLERCCSASAGALVRLRACTPQSTIDAFEGWRGGDGRWLQVARLSVAAQALLPPRERATLEVKALSASLRRCHYQPAQKAGPRDAGGVLTLAPKEWQCLAETSGSGRTGEAPVRAADGTSAIPSPCSEGGVRLPPIGQLARTSLRKLADEDTRLYALGCSMGSFSRRICAVAAPQCGRVSRLAAEQVEDWLQACSVDGVNVELAAAGMLGGFAAQAARLVAAFLGKEAGHIDVCDGDWVVLAPRRNGRGEQCYVEQPLDGDLPGLPDDSPGEAG